MSKKLNEAAMQNELSGSAFFRPAAPARQDDSPIPQNDAILRPQEPPVPDDDAKDDQSLVIGGRPAKISSPEVEEEKPGSGLPGARYDEQTKQGSNVRTNERYYDRNKIRHTFDIYEDQLLSLRSVSLERTNEDPRHQKVLLGDLVQEALDMFITKDRNKE